MMRGNEPAVAGNCPNDGGGRNEEQKPELKHNNWDPFMENCQSKCSFGAWLCCRSFDAKKDNFLGSL